MNRLKTLLLTAMLLYNTAAFAETVVINGITYDVVTKAKVATVIQSETGEYSGDIVIPASIKYNGVTCSVTSIGDNAFNGCSGITSIEIPNSVTSIGNFAFAGCSGLTSVEIPNSVTSIGHSAFNGCNGLTSIKISNSVTSIGNYAFVNCSGLTSVVIGNSVTSIGGFAFKGCDRLTSIVIGNSVTSIEEHAFDGCSGLTAVHISDLSAWCNIDFKNYDSNPLYYAKNLYLNGKLVTELIIPNDVTKIKSHAFENCSGLTNITIPNSVTSIGDDAFWGCSGVTNITIPNSVTNIGRSAFWDCSGLTSVEIPNSVTSIENSAFFNCSGLTSIVIPNSVTSIGDEAFRNCDGLASVTIGRGIEHIYSNAFSKCGNLTDVYCLATTVPETNRDAFDESYPKYMTLHVPAEAINYYKTTEPWSSFGTIVTLDGTEVETPVCATPLITYSDGKFSIECETEGAEFVTSVTCDYINTYYTSSFELAAEYRVSVYATAAGHKNSETVNVTLCWIDNGDCNNENSVINIPATAVLVTSIGGTITINCDMNGEKVEVYTTDGAMIGSATIENGTATVNTGLKKGSVAIINIAGKSIKVIVG